MYWPLTDNQGSVRDIAEYDVSADVTTIVESIDYSAFGEPLPAASGQQGGGGGQGGSGHGGGGGGSGGGSSSTIDFIFGYTAREEDDDVGLSWYRARWYDPATGRFVSEDPIGFSAGDTNLNRYVGNGPVNGVDPSGLDDNWTSEQASAYEADVARQVTISDISAATRMNRALARLIAANPRIMKAYFEKYGIHGAKRLENALRHNWKINFFEETWWPSDWFREVYIDETDRSVNVADDSDTAGKKAAELYKLLGDKRIGPAPGEHRMLQSGDIRGFAFEENGHERLFMAKARAYKVLKDVAREACIEIATAGIGHFGFLRWIDDPVELARLRKARLIERFPTSRLGDVLTNRQKYRFMGTAAQQTKYADDLARLRRQFGKIVKEDRVGVVNRRIAYGSFDPSTGTIKLFRGSDDLTEFEELLHWKLHNERLARSGWSQADFLKRWNDPSDTARKAFRKQYYDAAEAEITRLLRDVYGWVPR